ncbi:MAG: hypothetical protein AB7G28_23460 [Pirellulales bacterium]
MAVLLRAEFAYRMEAATIEPRRVECVCLIELQRRCQNARRCTAAQISSRLREKRQMLDGTFVNSRALSDRTQW